MPASRPSLTITHHERKFIHIYLKHHMLIKGYIRYPSIYNKVQGDWDPKYMGGGRGGGNAKYFMVISYIEDPGAKGN